MTLIELVRKLDEVVKQNPTISNDALVVFRPEGTVAMKEAEFTLTYKSERREGTTLYDQVPVLLIEAKKEEQWVCEHCNYMNVGVVCTHCRAPREVKRG